MSKKLDLILLIDDDEATNFIHKRVVGKVDFVQEVMVMQDAEEALHFLKSKDEKGQRPRPDIIFLDINMPVMDGWEFMEEYRTLEKSQREEIILVMLSTSLNPSDEKRANEIEDISLFMSKPLNDEKLKKLILEYFHNKSPPRH